MNRHADAAAVLAEVRATAATLGSEPLLARAEELARAGRGRGLDDEPWRPLTIREFEVARLIAEGLTNAEIAGELSIAPKTASAHVEHILAKLGVARRAEIATWVATVARPARDLQAHPTGCHRPSLTPAGGASPRLRCVSGRATADAVDVSRRRSRSA